MMKTKKKKRNSLLKCYICNDTVITHFQHLVILAYETLTYIYAHQISYASTVILRQVQSLRASYPLPPPQPSLHTHPHFTFFCCNLFVCNIRNICISFQCCVNVITIYKLTFPCYITSLIQIYMSICIEYTIMSSMSVGWDGEKSN